MSQFIWIVNVTQNSTSKKIFLVQEVVILLYALEIDFGTSLISTAFLTVQSNINIAIRDNIRHTIPRVYKTATALAKLLSTKSKTLNPVVVS